MIIAIIAISIKYFIYRGRDRGQNQRERRDRGEAVGWLRKPVGRNIEDTEGKTQ